MNNFDYLFRTRYKNLKYKKGKIVTFSVCLALFIIFNIVFVLMYKMNFEEVPSYVSPNQYENLIYSGIFKIINSIVIISFASVFTVLTFRDEFDSNIVSMELRQGYNAKDGFISRLAGYVAESAVFLGSIIIVNILFIGIQNRFSDPVDYQFFISSLGWYAIILIISSSLGIFFSTFTGVAIALIVSFLISLVIIMLGAMGMQIYQDALTVKVTDPHRWGESTINWAYWDNGFFTAKESSFNPIMQWSLMWNGMHYFESKITYKSDGKLIEHWNNYSMYDDFAGMAAIWPIPSRDQNAASVLGDINNGGGGSSVIIQRRIEAMPSLFNKDGKRIVFPEVIYLWYVILNSLIVFASYWIWKKKIKL